jgi:hypothetical protein
MKMRTTLAALALMAASSSAFAEVKLNDNFSVSGYVVGSYQYSKTTGIPASDRLDLDAVKTSFNGTFKPVTGTVSLFYPGTSGSDITVLDAYATVDIGQGYSVTVGKFLSYLGYEAFDPVNMTQITYGAPTSGPLFAIPAYHTGARIDFASDANSVGLAVVDSVYNGPNIFKGDGELKDNVGFEAFYKYTGTKNLIVWAGAALDTKGNLLSHDILTLDLWVQYQLNDKTVIAGEISNFDGGSGAKGTSWLAFLGYTATEHVSWAFRVSGTTLDNDTKIALSSSNYMQYTVAPTYKVNDNFSVRAEYSYYDYSSGGSKQFGGVQVLFKF